METVTTPIDALRSQYEVVIVGSGYGGAVAACRFAAAGRDVCVLERGRELRPGDYPRTAIEVLRRSRRVAPGRTAGPPDALFDLREGKNLSILVGCAVGGTSVIDGGVAIEPDRRVFDESWPAPLRGGAALEAGFHEVRKMLSVVTRPQLQDLPKAACQKLSAEKMGRRLTPAPLAIAMERRDGPVRQDGCTLCGDCLTGCNVSAKSSVLMNYLPAAAASGARIFAGVSVRELARDGARWRVHFDLVGAGREKFHGPDLFLFADTVVLAAGALGSTEILLRSAAAGLPLSDALGSRFSRNGDLVRFGFSAGVRVQALGTGQALSAAAPGPAVIALIDGRNEDRPLNEGFVVADGTVPSSLVALTARSFLRDKASLAARLDAAVLGSWGWAMNRTQVYHAMGHDDSPGRLALRDGELAVDWPAADPRGSNQRAGAAIDEAARAIRASTALGPLRALETPLTLNPLGGCAMAENAANGVVNHLGQVFSGKAREDVYQNLYVADGSVLPRSLGCSPLLTIAALAERTCALALNQARPGRAVHRPAQPEPRVGLQFTERMHGAFAAEASYAAGSERGAREGSTFEFVLTLVIDDVQSMVETPGHPARTIGTAFAPALSPRPMAVFGGDFKLFVRQPGMPPTQHMIYSFDMESQEGRRFHLEGYKVLRDDPGLDLWADTTTLSVTITELPGQKELGRGILHLDPHDFARQVATVRAPNARTPRQEISARLAFARLFGRMLFDTYTAFGRQFAASGWHRRMSPGKVAATAAVALLLCLLAAWPWRPGALRDQPPLDRAAAAPASLPSDLAALGMLPDQLRSMDLTKPRNLEHLDFHASWVEDNIVQLHAGLVEIPLHPAGIARPRDLALVRAFVNLTLIDDGKEVVAVGSQIETTSLFRSNLLRNVIYANTDWTLTLPGRGILFLSQEEGGPDLGQMISEANKTGIPRTFSPPRRINHTVGPLGDAAGPLRGPRGVVHGGAGDFAGAAGVFQEWNIVKSVTPHADLVADSEYKIVVVRAARLQSPPPADLKVAALSPTAQAGGEVQRTFRIDLTRDWLYRTRGSQAKSIAGVPHDVLPPSLGELDARRPGHSSGVAGLARTTVWLTRLRDENGVVVGEAHASIADASPEKDRFAQWTLVLPGDGTLYVVSEAKTGDLVLGGQGAVVGGNGIFAGIHGTATEKRSGEMLELTLRIRR